MSEKLSGFRTGQQRSPPLYAVFLISAAALGYEILLMRLFSIVQWHHFAYMVISLALLGYGVSGTFLTLMHRRLQGRIAGAFILNAVLFGIAAPVCFLVVQQVPFNTLELLWDSRQWRLLLFAYLVLFIPFFFAANCICLAFTGFGSRIARIYSYDLIGAGVGALGIVLAMLFMHPMTVLQYLGAAGLAAAAIASLEIPVRYPRRFASSLMVLAVLMALVPHHWMELNMSPYKDLSQILRVPQARVLAEASSPLGVITVVDSPRIPLRHAPGMSLNSKAEPPPQLGLYSDGDMLGAINRFNGEPPSVAYLDYLPSALPYHLRAPGRTLILGLGGGAGVLQALHHGAVEVDAVELNPQVATLVREDFGAFSGWSFLEDRVKIHIAEARGYMAGTETAYDLVQLALSGASTAASAGLYALSETYLYTIEAFQQYLGRLQPGGLLAVTLQLRLPPRDGLKLLATAAAALRGTGAGQPGRRLLMIRGWKTGTLLVKNGPFTAAEIERLKAFCRERSFDLVYYPGMGPDEANVYNLLAEPYYHRAASALLGEEARARAFLANYKFDISPATDDRPYFHNFFKWWVLPEILSLYGRGGVSLLELGYPVLILTLLQASLASLFLIVLPLFFIKRNETAGPLRHKGFAWRVAAYFFCIGLAFLFIEIAFMQRLVLFLSRPIYAIAVVLSGFLVFSGLGSRYAPRFVKEGRRWPVLPVVTALGLLALGYLWLLAPLFDRLMSLSDAPKILVAFGLIAPLAFCMGMPFPTGLARVSAAAPQLVPWAWGINGCASLISAILATLLAVHFGFTLVVLLALALYILAGFVRF